MGTSLPKKEHTAKVLPQFHEPISLASCFCSLSQCYWNPNTLILIVTLGLRWDRQQVNRNPKRGFIMSNSQA